MTSLNIYRSKLIAELNNAGYHREALTEKEQKPAELEARIVQGIEQFEAGLGKTFDDKDKFLNYLRNRR